VQNKKEMELYYSSGFSASNNVLSVEESNHCINVMRQRVNDTITVTDGSGNIYTGIIIDAHPKKCQVEVQNIEYIEPLNPYIHLAIAPTKNIDRLEWCLEKITEIGVNEITPVLCQHSERKQVRNDRLEKIVVAAMKQSGKYHLPVLNELTPFKDLINNATQSCKLIAHCSQSPRLPLKTYTNKSDMLILIGPEGDFSNAEIDQAMKKGFEGVSLGNSRLRTETAGVVACHTIRLINE
jgi:16S rRNA (uracil1498-N3)-methyltransferase